MHVHTQRHMCTFALENTYARSHSKTHVYIRTRRHICTFALEDTYARSHSHTKTHICAFALEDTYAHSHSHTKTLMYKRTHTGRWSIFQWLEEEDARQQKAGVYAQCVLAVCCSVLQCVAVCCSMLQCAAVCCNMALEGRCARTESWRARSVCCTVHGWSGEGLKLEVETCYLNRVYSVSSDFSRFEWNLWR